MEDALSGLRVVDLSTNAPGPFATKLLADMGAEVIRIANPAVARGPAYAGGADDPFLSARGGPHDALARGKVRVALDLRSEAGLSEALALIDAADVLVSEMRPGKLEALGLGHEALSARNPGLVVCEISGYGREGPLAARAGHDIDYIARSGVLSLIRDGEGRPVLPQNLLADYAAGGCMAVNAILAALLARGRTGRGRRIDLSLTDGVRYLATDLLAATVLGGHPAERWRGTLGGGHPAYSVYETADGRWMAVGALEPKFVAILAEALDWPGLPALVDDPARWTEAHEGLAARFATRTRDDWAALFDPLDACVAPVLEVAEAGGGELATLRDVFGG